jgi:hypothetical protein
MLAQGIEGEAPTPASEQLGRDAEQEREAHPKGVHRLEKDAPHLLEIEITIHPDEDGGPQNEGEQDLQRAGHEFFYVISFQNFFVLKRVIQLIYVTLQLQR